MIIPLVRGNTSFGQQPRLEQFGEFGAHRDMAVKAFTTVLGLTPATEYAAVVEALGAVPVCPYNGRIARLSQRKIPVVVRV